MILKHSTTKNYNSGINGMIFTFFKSMFNFSVYLVIGQGMPDVKGIAEMK